MKNLPRLHMIRAALPSMRAIASHEFLAGMRGKMIPAFALLFAALTIGITLAGLGATGQVLVQEFPRTAVSVLTLSVYLLPLMGLIIGASAASAGVDDGGTELLLAQPITRTTAIIGRVCGLTLCLLLISVAGFGTAGLVVLTGAGSSGISAYLFVALTTTILAIASLNVGVVIGVSVRRRATAVGWALAFWFAAAVLYDLAGIMILQTAGSGDPGPLLVGVLAINPIDSVRVLGMLLLGADVLLGPTGAATQRMLGGSAWLLLSATLLFWVLAPLGVTAAVYKSRDF